MYCRRLISRNVFRACIQVTQGYKEVFTMSQDVGDNKNKVYKVVLTGGNKKNVVVM